MKPEKRQLIHDLLDEQHDIRRDATLMTGGHILRQRRWRRRAVQTLAAVTLLAASLLWLERLFPSRAPVLTKMAPLPTAPVQSLTDAELLALFPDIPVGIVTLENGTKRLVFPRPGDEERLLRRL
jgi:hypothetical protein